MANLTNPVSVLYQNDSTGQPVAVGTTNPLPVTLTSGATDQDVNLVAVGGVAVAAGQGLMAASVPVAIASNQSAVPVSGTVQIGNTPNTTPILVQSSFPFNNITTATTTVVKSGAGVLHGVTVNTKGTVASTVTIYDNTAGSGSKIGIIDTLNLSGSFFFDAAFATGLTVVTTGTVAPDITVMYR